MKTQLYQLDDWREALQSLGFSDAPSEAQVEAAVRRELSRGRVTFRVLPADAPVCTGHRVTLRTSSALPKFNRESTPVTVGSGLYDPGIEEKLLGMHTGACGSAVVKDEDVTFTVLQVEEKVFPQLCDAFVQELQLDEVTTLAQYRAYMERQLRDAYAGQLLASLLEKLAATAQMDPVNQEDILRITDLEYAALNARFQLDSLTPEEWKRDFRMELKEYYAVIYPDIASIFGTTDKQSFYESRRDAATETVRSCLILRAITESGEEDTDPTVSADALKKLTHRAKEQILTIIYGGK